MANKIALGTVQFGMNYGIANKQGKVPESEAAAILSFARANSIDLLDTAIGYGVSEETLGKLAVDDFNVVTKLPPLSAERVELQAWVEEQVKGSMIRLGVNTLYGLLLHRSQDLQGEFGRQLAEALHGLKSKGLVQKIGVSIYDPSELVYVTRLLKLDLVQAPLNLVDRRLETSGWLSQLKEMGIEVHTRSAFLQGLLLMPRAKIPVKFERWSHLWDAWARRLVEVGKTASSICLSYPLSHPEVDRVVVGVDSLAHLSALVYEAHNRIVTDDWAFMSMEDEQLINPSRWSEL